MEKKVQSKNMENIYEMSQNPSYNEAIRKLKREDPADAETIFNPLFQSILENIHSVKLSNDQKAESGDMEQKLLELSAEAQGFVESHNQNENAHGAIKQNVTNITQSVTALEQKVERYYNGGNADMVDGKHASELQDYNNLTNKPASLPANGGNADTVDGMHAHDFETPGGAQQKDNVVKEWSKQTFSNPNLLINGGFQVWQRGTSFTDEIWRYTADRWYKTGSAEVTKIANGVRLRIKGGYNYVETRIDKMEGLSNRQCTLSVYAMNSTRRIGLHVDLNKNNVSYVDILPQQEGVYSTTFTMPEINENDILKVCFLANEDISFDVKYVKLELGEVATPYVPRPYGEELALCQRYYQKLPINRIAIINHNEKNAWIGLAFPEMRIAPDIKNLELISILWRDGGETGDAVSTILDRGRNNVTIHLITKITEIIDNMYIHIWGNELIADAEIYEGGEL